MFKKPVTAEPTFADRINAAEAQAGAALSIFETVVSDLNAAADAHRVVEAEILAEVERLVGLANTAAEAGADADVKASNLRALVG